MRHAMIMLMLAGLLASLTGCGTEGSVTGLEKAVDTAPPAAPTALQSAAGNAVVKLAWAANTVDPDLLGYLVYRVVNGQMILLTPAPLATPEFFDSAPWPTACEYAVTAVDLSGNESPMATIIHVPAPTRPQRGA